VRAALVRRNGGIQTMLCCGRRIWDSLGFARVGLIPRAGRLRRADGSGDEWVDAVIYYRSFVDEEEWTKPVV